MQINNQQFNSFLRYVANEDAGFYILDHGESDIQEDEILVRFNEYNLVFYPLTIEMSVEDMLSDYQEDFVFSDEEISKMVRLNDAVDVFFRKDMSMVLCVHDSLRFPVVEFCEVDDVLLIHEKFGWAGLDAWAERKNKSEMPSRYVTEYHELAREFLNYENRL